MSIIMTEHLPQLHVVAFTNLHESAKRADIVTNEDGLLISGPRNVIKGIGANAVQIAGGKELFTSPEVRLDSPYDSQHASYGFGVSLSRELTDQQKEQLEVWKLDELIDFLSAERPERSNDLHYARLFASWLRRSRH